MKYFFNGFVIVSHELGHATIESYVYQLEREVMPVIMYRFMYIFYLIKTWTKTFLHSSVEKHHCKGCTFDEDLCKLSRQKNDFNNFIDNTEQYPIVALTNEAASDVIGLTISGPYFPRALFDYAFRNIITLDGKGPPELDYDFKRLLTRISACYSFARVANLESKDSIRKTFNGIVLEAAASIRLLPNPYDKEAIQCVSCLMKLGSVIGSIFGMYFREVFKGAFARNSGKVADIQFRADPTVANRIRSGYAVCDSKPRQIIHACLELMDRKCEEPPAALFSLANNKNLT